MLKSRRFAGLPQILFVLISFAALSSFAQMRSEWRTADDILNGAAGIVTGTIVDLEDGRRFEMVTDAEDSGVRVVTDSIATRFIGFGEGVDPGEAFVGSTGFSKLREGDRVRVRGVGAGGGTVNADEIVLLGREVRVDVEAERGDRIEGIVRSVAPRDSRIVIETDRRGIETIVGTDDTPVHFRGKTYRIRNLEPGDRVRVTFRTDSRRVRTATSIDVIEDSREGERGRSSRNRTLTTVSGQITRLDPRLATFRVDTGREEILVDAKGAVDRQGSRFRLDQLRIGDRVELNGAFDAADTFRADTIRFVGREDVEREDREEVDRADDAEEDDDDEEQDYVAVLIDGTIVRALDASGVLIVRDSSGKQHRILIEDDFVVRTRNAFTTADRLEKGARVSVKAYRDADRNLIAQTVRLR